MVGVINEGAVKFCQVKSSCDSYVQLELLKPVHFHQWSNCYPAVPRELANTGKCLERFESECVKVVLFEDKGCLINYCEELQRVEKLLNKPTTEKKRKRCDVKEKKHYKNQSLSVKKLNISDKKASGFVKKHVFDKDQCNLSPIKKQRIYNPSPIKNHDQVKARHNRMLCDQYNDMIECYKQKSSKNFALILDSSQLTTQDNLLTRCSFQESSVLIPNMFEFDELSVKKTNGLFNCTLGSLLKSKTLQKKCLSFVWFDYMNSLDGTAVDKETSPREDMKIFFSKFAMPYTLFAVTLCLRHSKYVTHDYSGGTEVVIMRFVNDLAKDAGLYFSIVPPTGTYGSNMFLYAGVLLPL
jgi:hypothetical protein